MSAMIQQAETPLGMTTTSLDQPWDGTYWQEIVRAA